MEMKNYLIEELKRLNRMNDILERSINQETFRTNSEPEQKIVNNVLAMCEITKAICNLAVNGFI